MKAKDNDDDDLSVDTNSVYKKYSKRRGGSTHDLYLGPIVESYSLDYIELLQDLRSFSSEDFVTIYLDNNGGDADMGLRLARAIRACKATTVISLEANSYSAGAVIALSGDMLKMEPGTFLMFHNYSTLNHGKGGEYRMHNEEWDRAFWKQAVDIICPFLTKREIQQLKDDRDIYIPAPSLSAYSKEERETNKQLLADLHLRFKRHFPKYRELCND